MKLAKISLAALVALGAFSSVASATPLEEAIKNVDLSGYARYRYTNDLTDVKGKKDENGRHQFKSIFSFKAALDDNFFGVLTFRYSADDGSSGMANDKGDVTNTTSSFGVQEFYLGYKRGGTTLTAGKQIMGTYFTDDLAGTGLKVMNSDVQGLTLAAVAFDAIETGGDFDGNLKNTLPVIPNIYGLAAMGNYDPVNFKLWWTNLEDIANLYAADVALAFDLEAIKLGLQGQYVHNQAKHDLYSNANFFAAKADLGVAGFGVNAGYISFKAKDNKLSFVTIEDNGKLINPGKMINSVMNGGKQYYNNIMDDNKYWFVGASYKADKFGAYANYIDGEGFSHAAGFGKDTDRKEWNVGGNYKYSKKLNFSTFYAAVKEKKEGQSNKRDRIRFETRWNF